MVKMTNFVICILPQLKIIFKRGEKLKERHCLPMQCDHKIQLRNKGVINQEASPL